MTNFIAGIFFGVERLKALLKASERGGFAIEVVVPDAQALESGDSDLDIICTREMVGLR